MVICKIAYPRAHSLNKQQKRKKVFPFCFGSEIKVGDDEKLVPVLYSIYKSIAS